MNERELYDTIYRYCDKYEVTFEEVVSVLVEASEDHKILEAIEKRVKAKKKFKPTIVKDSVTGLWRLSTPLDNLGEI